MYLQTQSPNTLRSMCWCIYHLGFQRKKIKNTFGISRRRVQWGTGCLEWRSRQGPSLDFGQAAPTSFNPEVTSAGTYFCQLRGQVEDGKASWPLQNVTSAEAYVYSSLWCWRKDASAFCLSFFFLIIFF